MMDGFVSIQIVSMLQTGRIMTLYVMNGRLGMMGSKKEICKNCEYCNPSYKGGVCRKGGKEKKVKYSGTCKDWRGK